MKNQMARTSDEINQWRQKSIENINKYADQEIQALNDYYDRQRRVFDESRRINIETATSYVHHGVKHSELFTQLRDACNALEFQMAKLETIRGTVEFVKVMTSENQTKKKQENSMVRSSPSPTSPSSDRINRQSSATGTSNIDSDDNPKTKDDDSNNKCLICFMIYPSSMNDHDRLLHINQHYRDDEN